jgi:hypothetical protein
MTSPNQAHLRHALRSWLALADEIPALSRIAATAVVALPPDHPQRDRARVTSALTSMLHSAVTRSR